MDREIRYVVLKKADIEAAELPEKYRKQLAYICDLVESHRVCKMDKPPLECVVVEKDWPEYDETWWAIATRVDKENGVVPLRSRIDQIEKYGFQPL